jgi:hypothetical protein
VLQIDQHPLPRKLSPRTHRGDIVPSREATAVGLIIAPNHHRVLPLLLRHDPHEVVPFMGGAWRFPAAASGEDDVMEREEVGGWGRLVFLPGRPGRRQHKGHASRCLKIGRVSLVVLCTN